MTSDRQCNAVNNANKSIANRKANEPRPTTIVATNASDSMRMHDASKAVSVRRRSCQCSHSQLRHTRSTQAIANHERKASHTTNANALRWQRRKRLRTLTIRLIANANDASDHQVRQSNDENTTHNVVSAKNRQRNDEHQRLTKRCESSSSVARDSSSSIRFNRPSSSHSPHGWTCETCERTTRSGEATTATQ